MRIRASILASLLLTFSGALPSPSAKFSAGRAFAWEWGIAVASAQESTAAEALFRSAHEAAERGDWQTACDRFAESHRLDPTPGAALNLARCSEKLERWASAWKHYSEVVDLLPSSDKRAIYAQQKVDELEPKLPRLRLVAEAGELEQARVEVNGIEFSLATLGVDLPFDPGKVLVVVHCEGHEDASFEVVVGTGERQELALEVGDLLTSAPDAEVSPLGADAARNKRRAIAWLSVGAVGVGAGVFGGVWALVESNKVKQYCDPNCSTPGIDAGRRGKAALGVLASGIALGALGTGLGIHYLNRSKETVSARTLIPQAVSFSPGGATLHFIGSF